MLLKSQEKSRHIAWGGLLTGLSVLLIGAAAFTPTGSLALFALSSLCVAIATIRFGKKMAARVVLASALLSLLWPGPLLAIPYCFLFGPYPLIKAVIETKFHARTSLFLIRQLVLNVFAGLTIFISAVLAGLDTLLLKELPYGLEVLPAPVLWIVLILLAQVGMLLFDYGLTLLITLYLRRLHRPI